MCAIFGDVEWFDEVFKEPYAFFEIPRLLVINTSGAVQQECYVYFGLALLGKAKNSKSLKC